MKALIVDDSRSMRMVLSRIVKDLGYSAEEAEDGDGALASLRNGKDISLVLVDFNMPGMDGLEFIKRARNEGTHGAFKIVMVTSDLNIVEKALEAGADEFISKPFERDAVVERIRYVNGQQ